MKRLWLILVVLLIPVSASAEFGTIPEWDSTVGGSTGYPTGYLVKFNGTMWICGTVAPTNCTVSPGAAPPGTQWNSMAGSLAWNSGVTYQPGQIVIRQGTAFTALSQTTGNDPAGGGSSFWKSRSGTPPPAILATSNNSASLTDVEIQAAINAVPSSGGIVQLACATYTINATIMIAKPLILQGCGKRATFLTTSSATDDVIQVSGPAGRYVTIREMTIDSSTTRTAGASIHTLTTNASFTRIDLMNFAGHIRAIDFQGPGSWTVSNSFFVGRDDASLIDIWGRTTDSDLGGFVIENNIFDNGNNTGTAVLITRGGGVQFLHNAFLHHQAQVIINWVATTGASSEISFIGNAFDAQQLGSQALFGLLLQADSGTGGLGLTTIVGNSFGAFTNNAIINTGSASTLISGVTITGNTFSVPPGANGIDSSGANWTIVGNQFDGQGGGAVGVRIQAAASNNFVGANNFGGTWGSTIINGSASSKVGVTSGTCQNGIVISGTGC